MSKHMTPSEINHSTDVDELVKTLTENRKDQQAVLHELNTFRTIEQTIISRLYALRINQVEKADKR
jgi:hypothetical protein